ncbi:alpha-L-rhamnosidase [Aquibacillus albus]|uniref:alpha-L-rhamnosidase n=1 Tax=Aquibacillus albus TaxID=1168171 RepID=A0ABS2MXK9_9BACI|nr:alpha-L-rhamnosidase [Aquibacillus albus]MBM7570571.1 alpha-L-rhamnosidase [Aquibacillus albus]
MKITKLRTNQMENPLGFEYDRLTLSWVTKVEETDKSLFQSAAQVQIATDADLTYIIFDSGKRDDINRLAFQPDIQLKPRTRYYWQVTIWGEHDEQATSSIAWFETGKIDESWQGKWITPDLDKEVHPLLRKNFTLPSDVVTARAYVCGLGIYQLEINGSRISDEYFAPGFNAYDFWLQYQTYDVTDLLTNGDNAIGIMLGNGWYKGRFGFDGGYHELYGDTFAAIVELVVTLADGTTKVIGSDRDWKSAASPIAFSGIYDGEVYDANKERTNWSTANFDDSDWTGVHETTVDTEEFQARLSLPVKIKEERKPIEIIHTPAGETVLDLGQNMTGWVRFKAKAAKDEKLKLQYGEILQNGNFYNENLRTAKAEYTYISDGSEREVQPHFTFYGFRYVKLTGFPEDISIDDFTGCVMYSDIEETGRIETSNPLVNQLFKNAMWGQKGNFLDVPTDCPQRDERMGWTGDAQIFASTACYNMYSPAFYNKYMYDLREEQKRIGGSVPFIVPTIKPENDPGFVTGNGSAAWGDAATIIPWTLYMHYGDKALLEEQFDTMKDWVDYIKRLDDETGSNRLWRVNFHFGDWLALDGKDPAGLMGGTDPFYIASAYYCYSATLVAKAANVIGKTAIEKEYNQLAEEIKEAIYNEYFTANGSSAIPTQTAMVVALYMDLIPESKRPRLIEDLKVKLLDDGLHLNTGFVGTPYLCHVLSENGLNDFAYTLLLNEDYPSWLFAVKQGATTIWERWNSVLEDGSISGTGMNSLNHYAYGSIAEWMYRHMCGINPAEQSPGFQKMTLTPKPNGQLSYAKASVESASGYIESGWELKADGSLIFSFVVPFDTTAELVLPHANLEEVQVNGEALSRTNLDAVQAKENVKCELVPGTYVFDYTPKKSYQLSYSSKSSIKDLLGNNQAREIFYKELPEIAHNEIAKKQNLETPIRDFLTMPIISQFVSEDKFAKLDEKLKNIKL